MAQETGIEEVPILYEQYKQITWMIANASEQVDKNGRVKPIEREKKQVLNVAQDLMS